MSAAVMVSGIACMGDRVACFISTSRFLVIPDCEGPLRSWVVCPCCVLWHTLVSFGYSGFRNILGGVPQTLEPVEYDRCPVPCLLCDLLVN